MTLLNSREISRYVPSSYEGICGNERLIAALRRRDRHAKESSNLLIHGDTGAGKSSAVKCYASNIMCLHPDIEGGKACGKCENCHAFVATHRDMREVPVHNYRKWFHWVPIDCGKPTAECFDYVQKDVLGMGADAIIWLDEVHRLDVEEFGKLLVFMESNERTSFIATTSLPSRIPSNVRRRFAEEIEAVRPDRDALTAWLQARCQEWEIKVETKDTLALLARRSRQNVSLCQNVLSVAASSPNRCLTNDLIKSSQNTFDHATEVE